MCVFYNPFVNVQAPLRQPIICVHFLKYLIQIASILIYISICIDRYSQVSITWMQAKIASFSADNGLVPVLTTTPNMTRVLAARRKPRSCILLAESLFENLYPLSEVSWFFSLGHESRFSMKRIHNPNPA